MITRLACVAIFGIAIAGCGVFDQAEPSEPPSTSIVDTPNGDLEIITIPGFDNPPPADQFDTPELSGDPIADYLAYSGPTNIPFIQIDNGQLIGLGAKTNYSMFTTYLYAVSDPTDKSLDDRLNEIVGSISQKYPDLTPDYGSEETSSETRSYFDSRSTRLRIPDQVNIDDLTIIVIADSRYPKIKFVEFTLQMPYGTEPDPLPIGSAIDDLIGPLRDAAGLTNTDITWVQFYAGWEVTRVDGGAGMDYRQFSTLIGMNAGDTSPEQVQATIQPLLDSDWKQERVDVSVQPSDAAPYDTMIWYAITRPTRI